MDISQSAITVLTGLIGVLCGTSISSYFNLKSARKDLIFKRKLEYFEKLAKDLEENFRLYKTHILATSAKSRKSEIKKTLEDLKRGRKNFLIAASPLYFEVEKMTPHIINFVNVEKQIFALLDNLVKIKKGFSKERPLFELRESLNKLDRAKQIVILVMRKELYE